ncbi:MAG: TetR family transcriptional regulator [Streptosporangiales bacterium]|nr:TetR family transcriptional regulator [Streptosporangiales bacterium]
MSDEDVHRRILDAAEDCFLESGLTARIHRAIAERAQVSRPTVYKYVGDQQAILEALLDREVNRFIEAVRPLLTRQLPLRDQFVDSVAFTVDYAREHRLLQKMLREEPELVLPWFTLHGDALLRRAVTTVAEILAQRDRIPGEPSAMDYTMASEWGARVAISLITTPGVVDTGDPAKLRDFLNHLVDLGHPPPDRQDQQIGGRIL